MDFEILEESCLSRVFFSYLFLSAERAAGVIAHKDRNKACAQLRIGPTFFSSDFDVAFKSSVAALPPLPVGLALLVEGLPQLMFGAGLGHFAGEALMVSLAPLGFAGHPDAFPFFCKSCPVITVLASLFFCTVTSDFFFLPLSSTHLLMTRLGLLGFRV